MRTYSRYLYLTSPTIAMYRDREMYSISLYIESKAKCLDQVRPQASCLPACQRKTKNIHRGAKCLRLHYRDKSLLQICLPYKTPISISYAAVANLGSESIFTCNYLQMCVWDSMDEDPLSQVCAKLLLPVAPFFRCYLRHKRDYYYILTRRYVPESQAAHSPPPLLRLFAQEIFRQLLTHSSTHVNRHLLCLLIFLLESVG